jgi:hypothetical protein
MCVVRLCYRKLKGVLLSFGRKFRVHGCVGFRFSSGLKDV